MPSMSGGALRRASSRRRHSHQAVSMPSMSGGALRRISPLKPADARHRFLCPRCRAGLCDQAVLLSSADRAARFLCPRCRAGLCDTAPCRTAGSCSDRFLCPRCRAGLCDVPSWYVLRHDRLGFYALDVGRGFATSSSNGRVRRAQPFLCPRCRAGLCDGLDAGVMAQLHGFYALDVGRGFATTRTSSCGSSRPSGFYALDVGRGFATSTDRSRSAGLAAFLCPRCRAGLCDAHPRSLVVQHAATFLCPRCRAGLCDQCISHLRFAPQDWFLCPRCRAGLCDVAGVDGRTVHRAAVSMPSMSGGALRLLRIQASVHRGQVSMPSMSGGALRRSGLGHDRTCRPAFLCPRCRAGLCDVPS